MKARSLYLAVSLATVLLLAGGALAQSNLKIHVTVPFPFVAEDKTFAAGKYEITQLHENVLVLRNLDNRFSAIEKTGTGRCAPGTQGVTALVFHHVEGEYFLEQVTTKFGASAHQLLVSTQEKQIAQSHPMPTTNVVSVVVHDNEIGGK